MAGRRASGARPPAARAQHFLRSPALARTLVDDAGVEAGALVVDVGAGRGALTGELVRRRAEVVAVERDPELAALLRERFAEAVVTEGDARRMEWPAEPFAVVANLPFAGAAEILRRLLEPQVPLRSAALIVQWEQAARLTALWPGSVAAAYRGAWYELDLVRRLDAAAFAPPPSVAAGVVLVRRLERPRVHPRLARAYRNFLRRGFEVGPRRVVGRRALLEAAREHGFAPDGQARDLDARAWATLFAAAPSARPARLPARHVPL